MEMFSKKWLIRFGACAVLALSMTVSAFAAAHGPTFPPDPWCGKVAHGPTFPPDPWDGKVAHGPTFPPDPWCGKVA
jgi:hypothetical protein